MSLNLWLHRAACILLGLHLTACGSDSVTPPAVKQPLPKAINTPPNQGKDLLGANPPPVTDYSRTHVYVDLVKQARRFGTADAPWDEKAVLAADGWPMGDFGVFLMTRQKGVSGIGGRYTVEFEGRANVSPVGSPANILSNRYDSKTGLSTVLLTLPDGADQLALAFRQTQGNIKRLRVIRPGYSAQSTPLFTKAFLDHIQRFGTLRFMDWLRTNNNPVSRWVQRTHPDRVRYNSPNGVPWEHIIDLVQLTKQNLWINIPVAADDDYVLQLARLLKERLPTEVVIYVEYSNEVWNGQFKQHRTNWDLAQAEVQAQPDSTLNFDQSNDPNRWGYRRIAKRGKEIGDLFRQVYGDAAMMTTIRPVFATQVVNPYASDLGLDFIAKVYGPPSNYFYAMAAAPYFNLGPDQRKEGLTSDQVLLAMDRSIEDLPRINHFAENHALALKYQLRWLAYEGGADTFGPGSIDAKAAANMNPRMKELCLRYLNTWYDQGGELFMWFNAGAGDWNSPYGAWELTPDLNTTDTPKLRCMDEVLKRN